MIHHTHEQGSPEWLAVRRGCITGSRFKDCRDYKSPTAAQKKEGSTRGEPTAKLLGYAYDTARERLGGTAPAKFQNSAMRMGIEQEDAARKFYERRTRNLVEEVGFFTTDDGLFGLSPDGLIDDDGVLEIKTMVSSETLFTAVALGDISEYLDQCNGYLWLLGREWVDLALWVPDLQHMTIRRITRDEDAIESLESDLLAFAKLVKEQETKLRAAVFSEAEQIINNMKETA
jgi:exodeoxyribonuclease (lambda-induced)